MLPTLKDRARSLDVIRGFAVLGILLANIPYFASPLMSELVAGKKPDLGPVDQWVNAVLYVLVNGKFRSSLAILFGVGLALQYAKRKEQGSWPGGYLKRNLFLGILGVFHGVMIWYGDILFLYSIVAFFCLWAVGWSSKALKWVIGVLAAICVLAGVGALVGSLMDPGASQGGFNFNFWPFRTGEELAIFQSGTYLEQVRSRLFFFPISVLGAAVVSFNLVALFLLGFLYARSGVLLAPSQHPKTRNAALIVGFGIGLPLNALALANPLLPKPIDLTGTWEMTFGPLLAVGYVMLMAIAVEQNWAPRVLEALRKVGRQSLTSYLLQSITCSLIFYSWGGGLFGKLNLWQMVLVVPAVWAMVIGFAVWWQKRHDMGPFEWLHRSLTEGRRVPWSSRQVKVDPVAEQG